MATLTPYARALNPYHSQIFTGAGGEDVALTPQPQVVVTNDR